MDRRKTVKQMTIVWYPDQAACVFRIPPLRGQLNSSSITTRKTVHTITRVCLLSAVGRCVYFVLCAPDNDTRSIPVSLITTLHIVEAFGSSHR